MTKTGEQAAKEAPETAKCCPESGNIERFSGR